MGYKFTAGWQAEEAWVLPVAQKMCITLDSPVLGDGDGCLIACLDAPSRLSAAQFLNLLRRDWGEIKTDEDAKDYIDYLFDGTYGPDGKP